VRSSEEADLAGWGWFGDLRLELILVFDGWIVELIFASACGFSAAGRIGLVTDSGEVFDIEDARQLRIGG
jgi:hypothetical protein